MIIAVDGPTASGKGTIAKALAAHFGVPHLDTGLLYRAVGRQVVLCGGDPDNAADALAACDFDEGLLADPVLRDEATGSLASRVSIHPAVRAALFERQRAFATQAGGAVLDGRDIGTVIAPDATVKLFVTASVDARAHRRWREMIGRLGTQGAPPLTVIAADLAARDARDAARATAPLAMAEDAVLLDTSAMSAADAIAAAIAIVAPRLADPGAAGPAVIIHDYRDELAGHFRDINSQWITAMFALEPADHEVLDHPRAQVIDRGGAILFAEAGDLGIVGTAALRPAGDGGIELTKMGVLETARGLKVGERLLEAIIARAQALGADPLYLLTNSRCEAAIHLYAKAGFVHDAGIMERYAGRYGRCDVAMRYVGGPR